MNPGKCRARWAALVESLEGRRLLSGAVETLGTFSDGRANQFTFVDADGTNLTFAMAGPGTGTLQRTDQQLALILENTGERTAVKITAKGGDGRGTLDQIQVNGSLGTLDASRVDVHGDLSFSGTVGQLRLGNISGPGPHTLSIAGGGAKLQLAHVVDLSIDAPTATIQSLEVADWGDDDGNGADIISAAAVQTLISRGDFAADIATGQVGSVKIGRNADMDIEANYIGSVSVRGNLTHSRIIVLPAASVQGRTGLDRLTVGGAMDGVWVNTMASIGTVSAGAMFNSNIMAGIRYAEVSPGVFEQVLPIEREDKDFDFTGDYSIRSVTVSGAGQGTYAFGNSRIAAYSLGQVRVDKVQGNNGGKEFGVSAYYLQSASRRFGAPQRAYNKQQYPPVDFAVRQIVRPLPFRSNGDWGTYGVWNPGFSTGELIITNGGTNTIPPPLPIGEDGLLIARSYDDRGLRLIKMMEDGSIRITDAAGTVLADRVDLLSALLGEGPTAGRNRFSLRVVEDSGDVAFYGLARGGTSVFYEPGQRAINSGGTMFTLPTAEQLKQQLKDHKIIYAADGQKITYVRPSPTTKPTRRSP